MATPVEHTATTANSASRPLPTEVILTGTDLAIGFTPRELGQIKDEFGKSFTQIVADEADDQARFTVLAWLYLRRRGYTPTLEDMKDVLIRMQPAEPLDPTSAQPAPTSPLSATSGE